jgi:hypothetical protein
MFPASCPTEENVALVAELPFPTSLARGEARRLRRGDACPVLQTPSDGALVLSNTSIAAAVQISELIREQKKDPEC